MKQLFFVTLFFIFYQNPGNSQSTDSVATNTDSTSPGLKFVPEKTHTKLLDDNSLLNSKAPPVNHLQIFKKHNNKNGLFYLLFVLALILSIAKTIYPRYFTNMFRVFFNSSLRQSQLTDQLLQDKLPSMIFNIFFVVLVGIYLYILKVYQNDKNDYINWNMLGICIAAFAVIYFIKFLTLKFTGWITGYKDEAGIYIFIVFLINKIVAVCLLPILIVIAFSTLKLVNIFIVISFVLIGTMLFIRFLRSFALLQNRLKVSRFHFFLYIFSVEVLPLFLIYKLGTFFFNISL